MKFVTSAVRSAVRPITVATAMAIGLNMQAPFVLAVDVVVTTDADSGAGSLREAVGTAMSYRIGGLVEYQSENFYALVAGGAGSQDYEVRRWLDAFQGSSFAES